jgi:predicted lipoprotein with Yx(FWY)xxD motif
MSPKKLSRVMFVALLAGSVGLAVDAAPAAAGSSAGAAHGVVAKKKPKKKPTVKLATSTFGQVLVATDGRTLYAFQPDGTNTSVSNCTGGCAGAWPPLTATGKLKAGKGLDATKLTTGVGGQVAYNGHLLYEFSGDTAAGQTNGQGVGGVWHVIGADGNEIT